MTLPRGFGAHAERLAIAATNQAGFDGVGPVDIKNVAKAAGVDVIAADQLIHPDRLRDLERAQAYAFSACTYDIDGRRIIVYNHLHTPQRTNSDIAHELSHILLEHQLDEIQNLGGVTFRTCRADQEEQATALGAAILIPEKALITAAYQGRTIEQIAHQFNVTTDIARFRWNKTGITRRLANRKPARR